MRKILILLGVLLMTATTAAHGETFENGVKWASIPREYTETASLVILVKGGLFREDNSTSGIGSMFSRVWLKSGGLLEKTEFVGGAVSAGLSSDYLDFTMSVPTEHLDALLVELKRQLLTPSFSPSVFEREQDLALRELEAEKDDPNSISFNLFMQHTYGFHPYAMKTDGTTETVSQMTVKDVQNYYKNHISGADMIAVLAGNFTKKQENEIKAILRAIPKGKPIKIDCSTADISKTDRAEATDMRIQQSKLFVSYTAPDAGSPDYVYAKLLSELLGGGMSSPYFTALRKEKGYAYSVGVMYPSRLCDSRMTGYIGLQQENVEDAITTMMQLNANVAKNATQEDLDKSKNHIIGQMLSEAETNSRTAWYAAFFENLGLGFDHLDRYVEQIRAVKKEDLIKISSIFNKPYNVFVYKPAEKPAEEEE